MKRTSFAVALIALMASGTAFADNAIIHADNEIGIAATGTLMNYQEKVPSSVGPADTESGWMPGFAINYSNMSNIAGISNIYTAINFSRSSGDIAYKGAVGYTGHYRPYRGTDSATVYDVTGRVGMGFNLANNMMLTPYVVGGYQHWNRQMLGSAGYTEDYHAGLAGVGAMLQYAATPNLVITATPEFMAVVGGGMTPHIAGLTSASFGTTGEEKIALDADYRVSGNIHLYGGLNYTHFNYTGGPINAGSEPSSQTSLFAMQAGVAYSY